MADWNNPILRARVELAINVFNNAIETESVLKPLLEQGLIISEPMLSEQRGKLRSIFGKLGFSYHSDQAGSKYPEAEEIFKIYNEAYHILIDPDDSAQSLPYGEHWFEKEVTINNLSELRQRVSLKKTGQAPMSEEPLHVSPVYPQGSWNAMPNGSKKEIKGEASHDLRKEDRQEIKEAARATSHDADKVSREADQLKKLAEEEEKNEKKEEKDEKKEKEEDKRFLKSTYAKDSLKAVPGAVGNAIEKILSVEYVDGLLMVLGIIFGVYLSFIYNLWIIGIPIIIGALLIGTRPNKRGETIWGRIISFFVKFSGKVESQELLIGSIVFILGFVGIAALFNYGMILQFDNLQFAILALTNTLILFYLWTAVLSGEEKTAPAPAPMLALPPGQERLALPPGQEQKALLPGKEEAKEPEEKVALLEKKVAELEGRLEQKAIEGRHWESLPRSDIKMLAAEAESLKEEAKEERLEAKKLKEEANEK